MRFKKGDIVEAWWDGKRQIVFQLYSDARFDYYRHASGLLSEEKSWWASGLHLDGKYRGTYCHTFHLNDCKIHNSFGLTKEIKEHKL